MMYILWHDHDNFDDYAHNNLEDHDMLNVGWVITSARISETSMTVCMKQHAAGLQQSL